MSDQSWNPLTLVVWGLVHKMNDSSHTHWDVKHIRLLWMTSRKLALSTFYLVHELPLNPVDVICWCVMHQGLLSLSVCPYLQSFLHLYVTPIISFKIIYYLASKLIQLNKLLFFYAFDYKKLVLKTIFIPLDDDFIS